MSTQVTQQTINVYCCGGAGSNIGVKYHDKYSSSIKGTADLNFIFVDTSRSNIRTTVPDDQIYLIRDNGVDGSGKIRRENAEMILNNAEAILDRYPPTTVNLVINSTSGGSGSVIGPALVDQLLERDAIVFTAIIASADTRIELENTIKTLQTYEKLAQNHKRPVPAFYEFNKSHDLSEVDNAIIWTINYLSIAVGALGIEGSGLDTADLYNLVNFHRVSSAEPQLTRVHGWCGNDPEITPIREDILSMLIVESSGAAPIVGITPDYRCNALIPSEDLDERYPYELTGGQGPLGIYLLNGGFNTVFEDLSKTLKENDARRRARTVKSILYTGDQASKEGKLVL